MIPVHGITRTPITWLNSGELIILAIRNSENPRPFFMACVYLIEVKQIC